MLRFLKNRWTLILALMVSAVLSTHRLAVADNNPPSQYGDPEPLPPGEGDPDIPDGKTTAPAYNGTSPQKRLTLDQRLVGDDRVIRSDGVWRLILILKGLRAFWFRF